MVYKICLAYNNGRLFDTQKITEKMNKVVITDRMWARLLSSTNQPSFLSVKDVIEDKKDEEPPQQQVLDEESCLDDNLVNKENGFI